MSRKLKVGGFVLAGFAALVVGVAMLLIVSVDAIVKAAVETYGPEITGATVTLDRVEISPTTGKGAMAGLVVGNPPGFKTDSAFRLGEITVELDISSVTRDAIVIHEIVVGQPEITLEIGDFGSNFEAITRNAMAYSVARPDAGRRHAAGEGDAGIRFIVGNIRIRNARLNISTMILAGQKTTKRLPDIDLRDIGRDAGGVTAGEIVRTVLDAVGKAASDDALSPAGRASGKY